MSDLLDFDDIDAGEDEAYRIGVREAREQLDDPTSALARECAAEAATGAELATQRAEVIGTLLGVMDAMAAVGCDVSPMIAATVSVEAALKNLEVDPSSLEATMANTGPDDYLRLHCRRTLRALSRHASAFERLEPTAPWQRLKAFSGRDETSNSVDW